MALLRVVLITACVVATGLVATCAACVGRDQVRQTLRQYDRRLVDLTPYLALTGACYLFKKATHDLSLRVSLLLDWDITALLYAVEGAFVAGLQDAVPDPLDPYFSAVYMFGFTYLLLTPLVAYFLLSDQRHLKALLVAYVLNYGVGVAFYTLFVAYGPRNFLPALVEEPMFTMYPQSKDLTSAVGANTNVFPSLHTSMSVTVALFARRTRDAYPRWFLIASFVAGSVVLSTMVLGIHWLVDVLAGVVLGLWSVRAATRAVALMEGDAADSPPASDVGESTASGGDD